MKTLPKFALALAPLLLWPGAFLCLTMPDKIRLTLGKK